MYQLQQRGFSILQLPFPVNFWAIVIEYNFAMAMVVHWYPLWPPTQKVGVSISRSANPREVS